MKKIKYLFFIRFLSFFISFFRTRKGLLDLSKVKKVLIIRNDCIGDMIATTPFIRCLYQAGYDIYVSSRRSSLDILNENPYIKKCFVYDDKNTKTLLCSLFKIRKHNFDLAIDGRFHRKLDFKHLFFSSFLKTTNLLSYNKSNIKSFNISIPYYRPHEHVTTQLKTYLDHLSIEYDNFSYDIFIDPIKECHVDNFIRNIIATHSKIVIINPYGGSIYRSMSDDQIETICNMLKRYYQEYKIILIGRGDKFDALTIDNVAKFQSPSISDIMPLIKKADLVISVDTSIVHISAAFSTKCIAIYMEPLPPSSNNIKAIYSREFSDYKYLQQDLLLDKKYIKESNPDLSQQVNKDVWAPNHINSRQISFQINRIDAINSRDLVTSIQQCI